MDRNLLKFLAGVAGLAAAQLDEAAGRSSPDTAAPPPKTSPPGASDRTSEGRPAVPAAEGTTTTSEDEVAAPAAGAPAGPTCSLCGEGGGALFAGPCGAACERCVAGATPVLLAHLQDAANALRVENGLYSAALADLDRRTQALQGQMEALLRETATLRDERDRVIAIHEAERSMRERTGIKRIVVADNAPSVELWIDVARVDRALLFCVREFPGALIFVDDELQDVETLARRSREQSVGEALEILHGVFSKLAAQPPPSPDTLAVEVLPAVRSQVAEPTQYPVTDPALTSLVAHVGDELARHLHPGAPPYRAPKSRPAAATGRKTIDAWLQALHSSGFELSSGLHTAKDIAEHLNPGVEVAEAARLSAQTIVRFKADPGRRNMETLVRIAVAMGRADLFELRHREPAQTEVRPAEGAGWTDPTTRTIN